MKPCVFAYIPFVYPSVSICLFISHSVVTTQKKSRILYILLKEKERERVSVTVHKPIDG